MKNFIYDNSYEGLLTAVFYAYSCKEDCTITKDEYYTQSFLEEPIFIKTELDKFKRVYKSIEDKLGEETAIKVYLLYLCSIPESDGLVLDYLKLCYKYGNKINMAKNNDIIILVDKYSKKVTTEAHLLLGFVRFKQIDSMNFYSSIEPDHNVLPLLLNHFVTRFSDQNFIIHDLKRNTAILYNRSNAIIADFPKEYASKFINSKKDSEFEELWKTYYKSVNIEERKNLKLRKRQMPKRYWTHLPELH